MGVLAGEGARGGKVRPGPLSLGERPRLAITA